MGLFFSVGILVMEQDQGSADLTEEDLAPSKETQQSWPVLDAVNVFLREEGLPEHREPTRCTFWSSDSLRAAYSSSSRCPSGAEGKVPPPCEVRTIEDPVIQEYYRQLNRPPQWQRKRSFDHLINHSDSDGYYVPVDFEDVLFVEHAGEVETVGSSQQLLRECELLAAALEIPAGLEPESEAVQEAREALGQGEGWQRYGDEVFVCLYLMQGARQSIEQSAVLAFG